MPDVPVRESGRSFVADRAVWVVRQEYHRSLQERLWSVSGGFPSNSDPTSRISVEIGLALAEAAGATADLPRLGGPSAGVEFERRTGRFIEAALTCVNQVTQADWRIETGSSIAEFARYDHLNGVRHAAATNNQLATVLYDDHSLAPGIFVGRKLKSNHPASPGSAVLSGVVACKWMIPRDIDQRAINLLRCPEVPGERVVLVTAEPLPGRMASIAIGTGQPCTYHVALKELRDILAQKRWYESHEMLDIMVDQGRLRDILDLPLDLTSRNPEPRW